MAHYFDYIASFFEEIGWKLILDEKPWLGFFNQQEIAVILINTEECETSKTTLDAGVCSTIVESSSELTDQETALRNYDHQIWAEHCFNRVKKQEDGA